MLIAAKSTWTEVRDFLTERTVAILPIGSTEPHGPHLPLDTDVTIAEAQARRAGELLEAQGIPVLLLPALAYGMTQFTDGFAGTVSLRPATLWAMLEDIVNSLAEQGVRQVVFSNGHLEPEHVAVLRGVILDHTERGHEKAHAIFPDNTRRRWAQTLGEEFASGDCHAGSYETSIVLCADPESVRREELAGLEPIQIDLVAKMREGARNFLQCGATEAYCGNPAAASAEEGQQWIDQLGQMLATTVLETWPELAQ
ncbi:MAG: creatininase family protein [Planctomycetes bacterium]|nr:creatininase family protein [Planctomycetota bacterium]MCB9909711.1 creatininase family protein [Planctomycetota bacterium]MCB9911800.1 creatininase family protein [Planctomycetota bacterium]HPF15166.1 creatininase family protein [Planctomycetota bacterium]HRV79913.1 creatininase family protein [Planctomycetota bacterium]